MLKSPYHTSKGDLTMSEPNKSAYSKPQRIAAIVCIVLIVLVYLAALICNILQFSWAQTLGRIALGCTLILPALTWCYIWMIGKIFRKHTIADFDLLGQPTDHTGASIDLSAIAGQEQKQD